MKLSIPLPSLPSRQKISELCYAAGVRISGARRTWTEAMETARLLPVAFRIARRRELEARIK